MSEPINIICLKWGDRYSSKYVNKLYDSISKNVTLPFRFHCFTDDISGIKNEIETSNFLDLPDNDHMVKLTQWKKLTIFNKTLGKLKGMALFLDLDTVITSNMDCFIEYALKNQNKICMIKMLDSYAKKEKSSTGRRFGNASSAVIAFKIGKYYDVVQKYLEDTKGVYGKFYNEQAFVSYLHKDKVIFWPDGWCRYLRYECLRPILKGLLYNVSIPIGAKMVIFMAHPMPHEYIEGKWPTRPWRIIMNRDRISW